MNKKMTKLISICLIAMTIVSVASSVVFAASSALSPIDIKPGNVDATPITNVGGSIISILQTVGIVLSVVVLIVLGIKYMMGSAEEKAEYKKTMIPYLVGAALIFAASALAQVVFKFFTGISAS